MEPLRLDAAQLTELAPQLDAGSRILLSGFVYTARDAAHKKIAAILRSGGVPPFEPRGAVIYYAGPTQAPRGLPIGSCGPTTSARMDPYTPSLLERGLAATIGKGERSEAVCEAIRRYRSVYLCALGGAGALACRCIKSCEVVAFEELGCESVKRLYFEDFPLFVAIDCHGGNLFEQGRAEWAGKARA
ncbi:MAG: FumA C-terminus/TtdB family hydratase beta subunit [Clostridia bacterium]|nr:FumA C-terminus/TtdB family hydratase beta subunit [Clostridia bacterium]MDR3645585.1 FumA C-terminus/TtdB family hydratase beta subunit [Clostridia bacterium]